MLHFPPTHLPDKLIMQLRPCQLSTNHPPCRLFQHAPESPAHLFRVTAIKRKPGPDPFVWMVQWASSPGLETDHSISWEVCWTQHSSFSRVFRVWTKSSSLCFPFQMRRKTPSHNLLARLTAPNEFSFVSVAHECCLPASEILHSLKMHKSVEKSMRSPQVLSGTLSQHMLYMCFYLEMLHFVPLKNTNQNKNISKYAHSTIFTCYPRW